jgi:DNA-binding transcriptional LysR family regulator
MKVTLRQAEFFAAVARELHFGNAARALFVSQSVVSQEIRRLEENLGVLLFDRSTRNVRLTIEGEHLVPIAEELCGSARRFDEIAQRLLGDRSARFRLAATPSAMDNIVPSILREAETTLPQVQIEDVAVETGEVGDALLSGGCDLGIGRYIDIASDYRTEVIRTEPLFVALSSAHPLAGSLAIGLADLADLPVLLWPRERNPRYYDRLMEVCSRAGLEPLVLVSPPRIIGARSYLISDNRAFGLIPQSTAEHPAPGIVTIPLAAREMLPLELAWLGTDPRPQLHALVELVRRISAKTDSGD